MGTMHFVLGTADDRARDERDSKAVTVCGISLAGRQVPDEDDCETRGCRRCQKFSTLNRGAMGVWRVII